MPAKLRPFIFLLVGSFLCLQARAQSGASKQNDFESDGVSFSHPAGWTVKEGSSSEFRSFTLTKQGISDRMMIIVKQEATLRSELPAAMLKFTEPIVKDAANQLGNGTNKQQHPIKATVGTVEAEGVRLQIGARLADIVWLRTKLRLIAVVAMRSEKSLAGTNLWETVLPSLKLDPLVLRAKTPGAEEPGRAIVAGVLNGRALSLPKPAYPAHVRLSKVSGTVQVLVLIDEFGNVVSARAVSGHPLLHAVSVEAAREAKFSPTLLDGEPVRVTGVIQYNFVPQ